MTRAMIAFTLLMLVAVPAQPRQAVSPTATRNLETLVGKDDWARLPARLQELNSDIRSQGLHDFPGATGEMLTGYKYGEYYDWDIYFENLYLSYYGVSDYDLTNLKVFLDRQQPDGFISRTIGIIYPKPSQMFKPFMAQLVVLSAKQNGNSYDWLRGNYYTRLQKYVDRWFEYDADHNGLPVWDSADASGMDNQVSRSGEIGALQDEGVDLACYLVRELQAMSMIARALGDATNEEKYTQHAKRLSALINKVFWDDKDGFYYDRNEKTGKQIHVKSVAGFIPLWIGIASPRQARRLVHEHLLNKEEFWLPYAVATYSKTEPDYYQGVRAGECNWRGTSWVPTNYMIFHGLLRYGFRGEARELALKSFDMALDRNKVTREFYDADSGEGNGMNPFWGWSSLAYVMIFDLEDNYDPTNLAGPVRPLLRDVLGIRFNVDDSFLEPATLGGLVATPTRELAARDQLLAQKDEGMIR